MGGKPAKGQGTPAQGGEQGTLSTIKEQPEKAEEKETKKEETEHVKEETTVEPDKAEAAPHRNKKERSGLMRMMRKRRSNSLQRQSLLKAMVQTWKMMKRSLTTQRKKHDEEKKPDKAEEK